MDKKDILFEETFFDERIYRDIKNSYEKMAADLPQVLWALESENLPTSLAFLKSITKDEDSFSNWVEAEKQKRLGAEWLPVAEKDRVTKIYGDLLYSLSAPVARLRHYFSNGLPIIEDGNSVKIDQDALDKLCKSKATIKVDVKKLTEMYHLVEKINDDITSFKNYLVENNLPPLAQTFVAPVGGFESGKIVEVNILKDALKDFNKQTFFDTMKTYVTER